MQYLSALHSVRSGESKHVYAGFEDTLCKAEQLYQSFLPLTLFGKDRCLVIEAVECIGKIVDISAYTVRGKFINSPLY